MTRKERELLERIAIQRAEEQAAAYDPKLHKRERDSEQGNSVRNEQKRALAERGKKVQDARDDRAKKIARLFKSGLTDREIADRINTPVSTVCFVRLKLGLKRRTT